MATIINNLYFVGDNILPNTDDSKSEGQYYIEMTAIHEDNYLVDFLGYKMAKDLTAAIASNPTSGIWYKIWKGAEFIDSNGLLNKWRGLANSEKESPIANYVFTKILTGLKSHNSGVGVIRQLPENATPVSIVKTSVRAWNRMVELNRILDDFIYQNKADYPDYAGFTGNQPERFFIKQNYIGI
jgi:hypothetical protein